ncbi:MAG: phosphate ABC transporter permease PstA [Rhodobacteraceae bacterium]|nr:phosphate ABC transporter permease PstA [Paracoccaceae bacterium]
MISMTELSKKHVSPESAARLKKRKSAQKRLQMLGIMAITISGLALVTLLWSVFGKATGAITESYIEMTIELDADEIDRDNIRAANFSGMAKSMLKDSFPYVSGRTPRRQMYDLISVGAAFELRDMVMENPSLVGQTITFEFLASDIADLYLKHSYGQIEAAPHTGDISLVTEGKVTTIQSSAPDFAPLLVSVRAGLHAKAEGLRTQAQMQENGRVVFDQRAADGEDVEVNLAEAIRRGAARDQFYAQADELDALAAQQGAVFDLDSRTASVFVRVGDSWIKLETISETSGSGEILGEFTQDSYAAADWELMVYATPETARKVSDIQAMLLENLRDADKIVTHFNTHFFTAGDSREPELAGVWGAAVGSFWTMMVTVIFAFFIGVPAAIYLEEFAGDSRATRFVEVNINNLAAVPSIVFGLLGLSVFIGFFGMHRSSPIVGGIVLGIMTLPVIIIAARAAIKAVPPSIRDGAMALGASDLQVSMHHVLPLSMPGILTGTILGMARALGETAPLIMIGMVAFIVDIPDGPTDNATVLPVQIFRWADFPERAFEARTAAAIVVLLLFLFVMNFAAIILRKRFERRW